MNKIILHIEGLMVLGLSVYFYFHLQFSWIIFLILLFSPDLSILGYLKNVNVGSVVYNLFHTYIVPVIIMICGMLIANETLLMISLIWIAHISMDRMFGFGLKYPTNFQDTHLNRV